LSECRGSMALSGDKKIIFTKLWVCALPRGIEGPSKRSILAFSMCAA
jgi:hypothetical protein